MIWEPYLTCTRKAKQSSSERMYQSSMVYIQLPQRIVGSITLGSSSALLCLGARPATSSSSSERALWKGGATGCQCARIFNNLGPCANFQVNSSGVRGHGIPTMGCKVASKEPAPEPALGFLPVITIEVLRKPRAEHHTRERNLVLSAMNPTGLFKNNLCFLSEIIVVPSSLETQTHQRPRISVKVNTLHLPFIFGLPCQRHVLISISPLKVL